jgi:hypothetical protein
LEDQSIALSIFEKNFERKEYEEERKEKREKRKEKRGKRKEENETKVDTGKRNKREYCHFDSNSQTFAYDSIALATMLSRRESRNFPSDTQIISS